MWLVDDYYKAQLVYLQSTDGKVGELREKLMFQLHDTSFGNYHTNLFDISSNCLVCGNSDKNYGDKDGYEVTLVWIFDFQSRLHCLIGACDKKGWRMVPLYPYMN